MINKEPNSPSVSLFIRSPLLISNLLHLEEQNFSQNCINSIEIPSKTQARNFRWGLFFIIVSIVTGVIGIELVNIVLKGDNYTKPWMFAFITGSCFSSLLFPDVFHTFMSKKYDDLPSPKLSILLSNSDLLFDYKSLDELVNEDQLSDIPIEMTKKEITLLSLQIAIIYYLYNVFVMECLKFTSASNQAILGTTTSSFTLIIGTFLKIDHFTFKKGLCIIFSTIGILLINFSESDEKGNIESPIFKPKNPILGNALAICGALMYALYLIMMKVKYSIANKTTNKRRLFGFVGLFTFIIGIPILFLIDYFEVEKFEFPPPNKQIIILIIINGLFSVISDYTAILAMLLTSPFFTSLAFTTSIPITIMCDYAISRLYGTTPSSGSTLVYFVGVISVLISLILINIRITRK